MKLVYALAVFVVVTVANLLLPVTEARFASIKLNVAMTVAEDKHELTENMIRICAQETDISMEELHKFRRHNFTNTSEATQCFTHCIYEQMGLIRDGIFVKRDFISTMADIADSNPLTASKECTEMHGANKCETAFKIHQCRHEVREVEEAPKEEEPITPRVAGDNEEVIEADGPASDD